MQIAEGEAPEYATNGAPIEAWDFDSGKHQEWILTREYQNYYSIVSAKSGKALTVQNEDVNASGNALAQETNYGFYRQLWKFERTSNGTYVIRPRSSEQYTTDWCMSIDGSTENGTDIVQTAYNSADGYLADKWYVLQPDFYINVLYDNAYQNRYAMRIDNIANDMLAVHETYWANFRFFIAYSEATLFTSLADECPGGESGVSMCTHGNVCSASHHKNASNILDALPLFNFPDENNFPTATLAYIGHDICKTDDENSNEHIKNRTLFGLAHRTGRRAIITNVLYEALAEQILSIDDLDLYVRATVVHEVGHWFNALDHYDDDNKFQNVLSTDEINQYFNVESFSRFCMYGEEKILTEIMVDNHFCQGCKDLITVYIEETYQ